jgi:hypothetical protein
MQHSSLKSPHSFDIVNNRNALLLGLLKSAQKEGINFEDVDAKKILRWIQSTHRFL